MSGWRTGAFLPILLLGACCLPGCTPHEQTWPYEMTLGNVPVHVEVARTDRARSRGLMYRESLGEDWGMLFVYDREERLSFWMKNTKIPLSIAFLDSARVVRDIQDMTPFDKTLHVSTVPARYALEVEQGWFARRGVTPGTAATFSPELEAFLAGK